MTSTRSPVAAAVSLGLVFGLMFIPMTRGLEVLIPYPMPVRLTVWLYLSAYAIFLAGWGGASAVRAVFPLFLMGVLQFAVVSQARFWCLTLVILSWLRSGIFFPDGPVKTLAKELLVCGGGGLLIAGFHPQSPAEWALAVWLFALSQALFFVFFPGARSGAGPSSGIDPFEAARKAAERILTDGI